MDLSSLAKAPPTSTMPKYTPNQHLSHFTSTPPHPSALQPAPPTHDQTSTETPKRPLPPNITIEPTTASTLPSFRRILTLLLPIRYPDNFYSESITSPGPSSLSHVATWLQPVRAFRQDHASSSSSPLVDPLSPAPISVVGGIQCRLEPSPNDPPSQHLYIQTLAILSPYRGLGIATSLLNTIITTALTHHERVTEIYAHVWEANEEALGWYLRRGFSMESGVVKGYYRRLKPGGARVVRRRLGVGDWVGLVG